jgi:hypothetical protein
MTGVGAAREAVGARSISTSSTSKLSSLSSTDKCDTEVVAGARVVMDSPPDCLASSNSGVGLCWARPRSGLLFLLLALSNRPKPSACLNPDALGVSGVVGGVVQFDEEEDGRAMTYCLAEAAGDVLAVLAVLRGRTEALLGDIFVLGDSILPFLSSVDGVILIAEVRLTFKADALCGRGLIGRVALSAGE